MKDMLLHAILWHVLHSRAARARIVRIAGKAKLTVELEGITITLERQSDSQETLIASCAQPVGHKDAWERFIKAFAE